MGEGRGDDRDAVPSPASFGRAFLEESVKGRVEEDPPFVTRLAEHFGEDPRGLPIVSKRLSKIEHPNVHSAFEAWISGEGRSSELAGVAAEQKRYAGLSLSDLVAPAGGGLSGPRPGPVDYVNVAVVRESVRACVEHGLYLLREGEEALAALVSVPGEFGGGPMPPGWFGGEPPGSPPYPLWEDGSLFGGPGRIEDVMLCTPACFLEVGRCVSGGSGEVQGCSVEA